MDSHSLSRPSSGGEPGRLWGQLYGLRHRLLALATHRPTRAMGILGPPKTSQTGKRLTRQSWLGQISR
jgi:hypothetical protein